MIMGAEQYVHYELEDSSESNGRSLSSKALQMESDTMMEEDAAAAAAASLVLRPHLPVSTPVGAQLPVSGGPRRGWQAAQQTSD